MSTGGRGEKPPLDDGTRYYDNDDWDDPRAIEALERALLKAFAVVLASFRCRDLAADARQEGGRRAIDGRRPSDYGEEKHLACFVVRCAWNWATDDWRRDGRQRRAFDAILQARRTARQLSDEEIAARRELRQKIRRILHETIAALSADQRVAVEGWMAGRSLPAIADDAGVVHTTTWRWFRAALDAVRTALKANDIAREDWWLAFDGADDHPSEASAPC